MQWKLLEDIHCRCFFCFLKNNKREDSVLMRAILFTARSMVEVAHCVTYFENSCSFIEAQNGTNIFRPDICQNVNTGRPVNSFLCAPTDFALCSKQYVFTFWITTEYFYWWVSSIRITMRSQLLQVASKVHFFWKLWWNKRSMTSDCHGFEKPTGKCVGCSGVWVWVATCWPSMYLYPWCRLAVTHLIHSGFYQG